MKRLKIILFTIILLWLVAQGFSWIMGERVGGEIISKGVAIVPIHGTISISGSQDFLGSNGVGSDSVLEHLKKAASNKGVKAVILEINSGGGAVVASREIANYVKSLNEKKPVVAWIREVGASGAYWIASGAEVIIADEMSITGSLGVISSYLEYSGLMEKYGVGYERLVAGKYKDLGTPFKELDMEERILMESKLNKIQELFIKEVSENRRLNANQINEVKSGFFYLGSEAKDLGLIDLFGGREEAVSKAKELGNVTDGKVIVFKSKKSLLDLLERVSNEAFFNMGRGVSYGLKGEGEEFHILA